MSDDRVRAAFKTELDTIIAAESIPFARKDTENVYASATGETGFTALEFDGGPPMDQYTFGAPGNNFYRERGNVWIRVVAPLNSGNDVAGYARAISDAFLQRRFALANGWGVRTLSSPPSPNRATGRWIENVAVSYLVYNLK
jgi:hypothetical protein